MTAKPIASLPIASLLARTSVIAIGFGLVAFGAMTPVNSQSFLGTPSGPSSSPGGFYDGTSTGSGTTDVLLNSGSPQTVINWTPTDTNGGATPISFQPAGTTTRFIMAPGGSANFAVLNRIVPTGAAAGRSIQLDGTIQSLVNISGANVTGGQIYFYSPNGILIGSNAQIDVGALGLTTSDIAYAPGIGGGTFIGQSVAGQVVYTGANPGSSVVIQPGAQINAPNDTSSYVAIFSPYIQQGGSIDVNGSTALVAAEAGSLTWNTGLFTIQTTTGTDGNATNVAIQHTGSTGGTGSTNGGDYQRVYVVAVPKNTAITTLILSGSQLGFGLATSASTDLNAVVLSGGYDVFGAPTDVLGPAGAGGTGLADIQITNANVSSYMSASALRDVTVRAVAGGPAAFTDIFVRGAGTATVQADALGSTLAISGDATIAADIVAGDPLGLNRGTAGLYASNGGQLTVGGTVNIRARDYGTPIAGINRGGTANVQASTTGAIDITGDLLIDVTGDGANNGNVIGQGGTVTIFATGDGSAITVDGALQAIATGFGGQFDSGGVTAGNGQGGTVQLYTQGGGSFGNSIQVSGVTLLSATGKGGDGNGADAGDGFGGTVRIAAEGALDNMSFGIVSLSAIGQAGLADSLFRAGGATGGTATLQSSGPAASVIVGGTLNVTASAVSFNEQSSAIGAGTVGGGDARITASDGTITILDTTNVVAEARVLTGQQTGPGYGGNVVGGNALVEATGNGTVNVQRTLVLSGNASGGDGIDTGLAAGTAQGGTAFVTADQNGTVSVSGGDAAFDLSATAMGGNGTGTGSSGAAATGGSVGINALGSGSQVTITLPTSSLTMDASAQGGAGSTSGASSGGTATGGSNLIFANTGVVTINATSSVLKSGATGGAASSGAAGDANGGSIQLRSEGDFGRITLVGGTSTVDADMSAAGGFSIGGAGGDAQSGSALFTAGTTSDLGSPNATGRLDIQGGVRFTGTATAGDGATGGSASSFDPIFPETVRFRARGSELTVSGDVDVDISAFAGNSSQAGQAGGSAVAGLVTFEATAKPGMANPVIDITTATLTANAQGGNGGGVSGISSAPMAGGAGGSATGGSANFFASADLADSATPILTSGDVTFDAGAIGGAGGIGETSSLAGSPGVPGGNGAAGGDGGTAIGGAVSVQAIYTGSPIPGGVGGITMASLSADLTATGGNGGASGDGAPGFPGDPFALPPIPPTSGGPAGQAGVGGNASTDRIDAGATLIRSVGAPVVITGTVAIDKDATGGDGGSFGSSGFPNSGGNATVGGVDVFVDSSDGSATGERGSINLGGLVVSALANTNGGIRFFGDGSSMVLQHGLFSAGSLLIDQVGDFSRDFGPVDAARLFALDATVTIPGFLALTYSGDLSFFADSSSLSIGNLFLDVGNFVSDISGGTPAAPATVTTTSTVISSAGDIILDFDLASLVGIDLASSNGLIQTGDLTSIGGDISISAAGSVTTGDLSTGAELFVEALSGDLSTGALDAGTIDLSALSGAIATGAIDSGAYVFVDAGGDIVINGAVVAGTAGPDPDLPEDIVLQAGGGIASGSLTTIADIVLFADSGIVTGDLTAGQDVFVDGAAAGTFGAIHAGQNVDVTTDGDLTSTGGTIISGAETNLDATGTIQAGNIQSGTNSYVTAGGNIALGSVSAGGEIGLGALGSVSTGNLTGIGVGVGARDGSISAGTILSPGGVLLLARTGVAAGGITTLGGPVYIADSSLFPSDLITLGDLSGFDPLPILAAIPVPMSGPVSLGPISGASSVMVSTAGNLTVQSIGASSSDLTSGLSATSFIGLQADAGLLTVNGVLSAPSIHLISADIALGSGANINAGTTGRVHLSAVNTGAMRLGDGTSGPGYLIDNTEFARINSGELLLTTGISATDSPIPILIGTLGITGPLVGSTVDLPAGDVLFATGVAPQALSLSNAPALAAVGDGVIRVTGSLTARGFTATNGLVFNTGILEVDAGTGLIEITNATTGLSGMLEVDANGLRAASSTILGRLADNPNYTARANDLNSPLGNRPDGVIRAAAIDASSATEVLIQNSGTRAAPAGLLTNAGGLSLNGNASPGTISLILNGQFLNPATSDNDLHDLLATDQTRALFTQDSMVNGCLVSLAVCAPPPPDTPPVTDVVLTANNLTVQIVQTIDTAPPIVEDDNDARESGSGGEAAKKALIIPPAPLISTRPLNPVIDIDEPVSGSGNPGLVGGGQ